MGDAEAALQKRKRLRLRGERWLKYYERREHQAGPGEEMRVRAQCKMCEWNIHWQVTRMRAHLKTEHGIDVAPEDSAAKAAQQSTPNATPMPAVMKKELAPVPTGPVAEVLEPYMKIALQHSAWEKETPSWFREYSTHLDNKISQINQNLLEMNSKFMRLERIIEKLVEDRSTQPPNNQDRRFH